MKETNQHTEDEKEQPAQKKEVVIRAKGIKKSFGKKQVLKDISFDLKKGENIVVLGKSGQGKSVTIQCVVGMLQPDGGSLEVFGEDITTMDDDELKQLRIKIGFLFQGGALYDSMTVRDNLEFPLTRVLKLKDQKEINKKVEGVLDAVGLLDAIDKMPSDLSGGMRKRVGLARTLIVNPEIMLYDEPTTGLDPITSREISELINRLQRKYEISSVIITHDMECARITADRILVMDDGKYIAEGSYKELEKSDNEMVRSFFNVSA
ncbi:ATP-binding cassette domain-containing protein [Mucilaginibacter rubeus]|uniref:ATP-binding cassette domain-containing protein n=1 Tax=Mucilaginibacter rubeus TaxID=2027860 RepID=A0AAE6JJC3_9SPHI|nr:MULTISPECIES: ATP-binding cassette domain-containing protein [Mucilaginibacter]QEM06867.1 ATP-binding cassette domain-containing protein [Mucilaginibacter rubeus]QEM19456.1 ATP-binding cassette domain-containing protein [Mucilaginibacter gossypii]QTE43996.1 ATP-binding cassette domain-containing protein [Mucilaginibacter rubeus]QTE50597.1 ATP-binding cassette domain-containing protein [Mucilaginibacter rubeus]QTE55682.1 ATP-binding cassette domain-containing protein [Mucilaginibacter rubeus